MPGLAHRGFGGTEIRKKFNNFPSKNKQQSQVQQERQTQSEVDNPPSPVLGGEVVGAGEKQADPGGFPEAAGRSWGQCGWLGPGMGHERHQV